MNQASTRDGARVRGSARFAGQVSIPGAAAAGRARGCGLTVLALGAFGLCSALGLHVDREQLAWSDTGGALPCACWFHSLTGLQCPTCGLSRSVVASLQGQWDTAWACHPVGPLWAAAGLALFAVTLWSTWRRRPHVWRRRSFWTAAEALALLSLVFGLLRSWAG